MQYRKKPIVIEAIQWDGAWDGFAPVAKAMGINGDDPNDERLMLVTDGNGVPVCITIPTLEGEMRASPGDWIIKGVTGELYPCKPDIFAATYEPAALALAPSPDAEKEAERIVRDGLNWPTDAPITVSASATELRDRIAAALSARDRERDQAIAAAVAAETERCAAYMEHRATEIEAESGGLVAKTMGRIYRDEAAFLRTAPSQETKPANTGAKG